MLSALADGSEQTRGWCQMFLPDRATNEEWLGVVIAVPEPWNAQITEIRQAIGDPMALSVPPHVTLMPPLAVDQGIRAEVFEHLRKVASSSKPFQLELAGSGSFEPVSPVSFLQVIKGAKHCAQLAEDIRSGPLDYSLRFPYHAHVTLAQKLPAAALQEALELGRKFSAQWMVQGFRVDRVESNGSYISTALFDFSTTGA